MQYSICPKCQFRIVNGRQTCSTCGHALHTKRTAVISQPSAPGEKSTAAEVAQPGSFWRSLFGIDKAGETKKKHDEPALGES